MSREKFTNGKSFNPVCARLVDVQGQLSNKAFAEKLGISQSTLFNYLRGRIPPADFVSHVCKLLDINGHWLLTGEGLKYRQKSDLASDNLHNIPAETQAADPTLIDQLEELLTLERKKKHIHVGGENIQVSTIYNEILQVPGMDLLIEELGRLPKEKRTQVVSALLGIIKLIL